MPTTINEKFIQAIQPGEKTMCDTIRGFGVKCTDRRHNVVFFVRRRVGRKDIRRVIGCYPRMTVRVARRKAMEALLEIEKLKPVKPAIRGEETELGKVQRQLNTLMNHVIGESSQITFAELVDRVADGYLAGLKETTRKTYVNYINSVLLPEWGTKVLSEITSESVQAWRARYKGPSGGKPTQPIKILKCLLKIGRTRGLLRHKLEIPGCYKSTRGEEVDSLDIKRLRRYLRDKIDRDPDIRDYAILLATYTGERSKALVSLHSNEVNFRSGVTMKPRKGGKVEPIPYSRKALDILRSVRPKGSGYFFPHSDPARTHITSQNLRRYFQAMCVTLKITLPSGDRPKIHSLRHSFLTEVANKPGHSLMVAATLAGHEDPKTTARYTHKDLRIARAAANKL